MDEALERDFAANAAFWAGRAEANRRAEEARPSKGRTVEVVRGRKVPIGTVGTVGWFGETKWGFRVGLIVEGENDLVFTAAENVRVVREDAEVAA